MESTILLSKKVELIQPPKKQGSVTWRCPSNIALIKYWGKYEELLPFNPSISLTLKHAYTETKIDYVISEKLSVNYYSEGIRNAEMSNIVLEFLKRINNYFSNLSLLKFDIHISNSFPQNSGINQLSSAIGSLALCLCSIEEDLTGQLIDRELFFRKASFIARLGSGCATRSIYGGSVLWGNLPKICGSTTLYSIPLSSDPFLENLNIANLIVSTSNNSNQLLTRYIKMPFYNLATNRCDQAKMHALNLLDIIREKDYFAFCKLVEGEALALHTMMFSSSPQSLLFYPETRNIISEVRIFRKKYGLPFCFTLDASPNIYLLYPNQYREIALNFIGEKLLPNCEEKKWFDDKVGSGPEIIN